MLRRAASGEAIQGVANGFVKTAQSHGLVEFLQHIIPDTLRGPSLVESGR